MWRVLLCGRGLDRQIVRIAFPAVWPHRRWDTHEYHCHYNTDPEMRRTDGRGFSNLCVLEGVEVVLDVNNG